MCVFLGEKKPLVLKAVREREDIASSLAKLIKFML
jgi:hypothetical protein